MKNDPACSYSLGDSCGIQSEWLTPGTLQPKFLAVAPARLAVCDA